MKTVDLKPFTPADADWLVRQHGDNYAKAEGFDHTFGPLVARILADFVTDHDPTFERGWIAWQGDQRLGSIFCVRLDDQAAKLRLFLLVPQARGLGLGRKLLDQCMGFARECGYKRMSLWTHESHKAACALYAKTGWTCTKSEPVVSFGVSLVEQAWEISL